MPEPGPRATIGGDAGGSEIGSRTQSHRKDQKGGLRWQGSAQVAGRRRPDHRSQPAADRGPEFAASHPRGAGAAGLRL